MKRDDIKLAKKKILKCLTEDFSYGTKKDGTPLARPRKNTAIFDKKEGYAIFHGTDLNMIMDKVILGLYLAMADSEQSEQSEQETPE